jgi:hypothetical protein
VWLVLRFQKSALCFTRHPALVLGFLCVGLLGACFFALSPFFGARSEVCQPAPCCQCVMLVCWLFFHFAMLFDFGCCSLAQDMSFVHHYLPYFSSGLSPTHFWLLCLSSLCLLKVHVEISSLLLPPSLVLSEYPTPSAACTFSVPCLLLLLFLRGRGSDCPESYAGLSQERLWKYCVTVICLPAHLLDVSQAGLEPVSGSAGSLWLSQCNVAWRSFVWAGGSGCWSPGSSWCFFLPSVAPVSQQNFWLLVLTLSASVL